MVHSLHSLCEENYWRNVDKIFSPFLAGTEEPGTVHSPLELHVLAPSAVPSVMVITRIKPLHLCFHQLY